MGRAARESISLDGLTSADRRNAPRKRTVLAIGRMTVAHREQFCIVRDISEEGIRIETQSIPSVGERVLIEMRGLAPCWATVKWCDEERGGLAFDQPQPVQDILSAVADRHARTLRSPRFAISTTAYLTTFDKELIFETVDISIGGVKLLGLINVAHQTPGRLHLKGNRLPLPGVVSWTSSDTLGFRFLPPLSRETLVKILDSAAAPARQLPNAL